MSEVSYRQPKLEGFDRVYEDKLQVIEPQAQFEFNGTYRESRLMLTREARQRLNELIRGEVELKTDE